MAASQSCDLIVIGGGINGAGIARDAAGRGLSVLLCEKDDLASHTSSSSTKLIHGGLRYLEQYEFKLVAKALKERDVLLHVAPHIIRPLRFIMPYEKHRRPAWMIRCGLLLYDHLGGRQTLEKSRSLTLAGHPAGRPLKGQFTKGFAYSDAAVQDARLVVLNCMDAAARGADIRPRTLCESARRRANGWDVTLRPSRGQAYTVHGRALVNATGPWAASFLDDVARRPHGNGLRLIKGSHIVVSKLFDHDNAYIFQEPDGRVVFAIPYERDFTLIGTTDIEYDGDLDDVRIDTAEVDYLCRSINNYFERSITPDDVVWTYSGVRPLVDDHEGKASEITRDYHLQFDGGGAPLLNIFGGKLTTFRRLAEDAVNQIAPRLGNRSGPWTGRGRPLPGGDEAEPWRLRDALRKSHPSIPEQTMERLVFSYGTRVHQIVGTASRVTDLGLHFGADLYQAEVDYLVENEWAQSAEDILWRRSKLGLRFADNEVQRLSDYLGRSTGDCLRVAY